MINLGQIALIGLMAAAGAVGCTASETPQANDRDVGLARDDVARAPAAAERRAAKPIGAVAEQGKYDMEMAQADGNHQMAIHKCEVLSGMQAKACRAQADADYEMLKSIAKTQYPDLASAR